jgi:hypothetical protein
MGVKFKTNVNGLLCAKKHFDVKRRKEELGIGARGTTMIG